MTGGRREQLTGFLDFLRATVVGKAEGLTDEQARRPLVANSPLTTISSLVSHLTFVERYWFGQVLDGREPVWVGEFETDPDADFRAGLTVPLDRLVADYLNQCAVSREIFAGLDFDATGTTARGAQVDAHWVVAHMIEETARHAGHLDLLRENIDGRTGE